MNIFITGASGFVGGAATKHLVAAGHRVMAMSRSEKSDEAISSLGAMPIRCDLENVTADHLNNADVCIHCAAFVGQWGDKDIWYRGNVLGTRNVLQAAKESGVSRFVHIGSEAGLVKGQHLLGIDESYPLAPDSSYSYCATKAQAEQLAVAANGDGFEVIVLRPRLIWGEGDQTLLPAIEEMCARGNWVWIDGGRASTSSVHIDNLVHAIELSLTRGVPGQAYFIVDDGNRTMKQIVSSMASTRALSLGDRSIPAWLADGLGWLCESAWRLLRLRSTPPLTRHAAMVMSRHCVLQGDKAKRELGYSPVISFEDAVERMRSAQSS
ncbi:MAG: NAD-dependent epimerase/dehydratase family protein [Pseudomonadota bacterium]|nr:NAD-dependent epimerase/dehydratase family protein [Pseudomonadota bacterium]